MRMERKVLHLESKCSATRATDTSTGWAYEPWATFCRMRLENHMPGGQPWASHCGA
jgi:hypothetical protein